MTEWQDHPYFFLSNYPHNMLLASEHTSERTSRVCVGRLITSWRVRDEAYEGAVSNWKILSSILSAASTL